MESTDYFITEHAKHRMFARSISKENIELVLQWGKVAYIRGAKIHCVGKKEIEKILKKTKMKLNSLNGIQVVCTPRKNVVMTVYKNRDFKNSLKDYHK